MEMDAIDEEPIGSSQTIGGRHGGLQLGQTRKFSFASHES